MTSTSRLERIAMVYVQTAGSIARIFEGLGQSELRLPVAHRISTVAGHVVLGMLSGVTQQDRASRYFYT